MFPNNFQSNFYQKVEFAICSCKLDDMIISLFHALLTSITVRWILLPNVGADKYIQRKGVQCSGSNLIRANSGICIPHL